MPIRGMPTLSGGGMRSGGGNDSLQFEKRNFSDDSVTVIFRYLDSARFSALDSSINDFYKRIPLKPEHIYLGNIGNASRPVMFSPIMKAGWDPGFHAFDPFALTIADTRFMNTTKPYTELNYIIGSQLEQQVGIMHTQNIKPNWNFVLNYRLINAPGAYNSQNTNHTNFRFNTHYTSIDQRYNLFFIALNNSLQSSENGGIESDTFIVNQNQVFNDRFNIPTRLADSVFSTQNFFSVKLNTGNQYKEKKFLLRQQYDFGKKDSIQTDSSVYRFFLPRLRMEHTVQYNTYQYRYLDIQAGTDSAFYIRQYGLSGIPDTLDFRDKWKELSNDFSLIQFPDPKNPLQFFKVGATLQNLAGNYGGKIDRFYNISTHGEYRNRTRNRKWDMLLFGEFYFAGRNAGDYFAQARMKTQLSKKLGFLELGFQNVNRSPSLIFERQTGFPVKDPGSLNKENTILLSAMLDFPRYRTQLSGQYFLVSNYTYFNNFNTVKQASALFNFLRIGFNKEFILGRSWHWYLDLYFQTKTGNAPVNLPLIYTRNRFAYEGKLFTNLKLSTGVDIRYLSPYNADNYSPVLGQFFFQESQQIAIRPDIAAYVNFKIRNFTTYARFENLNTLTFKYGFGFKQANLSAPYYPMQDLHFRLGVFWGFVN
ncbi:MAG: putative porin [Chitinophagaceae bacterium]